VVLWRSRTFGWEKRRKKSTEGVNRRVIYHLAPVPNSWADWAGLIWAENIDMGSEVMWGIDGR
jgi:hypothetical protein